MDILKFGSEDIANKLAQLTDGELDDLAFGAVKVDKEGIIQVYNETEGMITGRDPKSVIGKSFFTEVAPCTNKAEFFGNFKKGVEDGSLNVLFEYTFDYKMEPTKVKVHMMKSLTDNAYWIFVKRV